MRKRRQFKSITEERHYEIEKEMLEIINDEFKREELTEDFFKYEVELQGSKFVTVFSDDELKKAAKLAVDVIEELKEINNNGINKTEVEKIVGKIKESKESEIMGVLYFYGQISTDRLKVLVGELDIVTRVGGAWAMLISNPMLISAICAVYERIVDNFDDEDLYSTCCFFIMRAVMKMHGDEKGTTTHSNLKEMLEKVEDSYDGFVAAVLTYTNKNDIRYECVRTYMEQHPKALSSDILEFISKQNDFYDDAVYEKR